MYDLASARIQLNGTQGYSVLLICSFAVSSNRLTLRMTVGLLPGRYRMRTGTAGEDALTHSVVGHYEQQMVTLVTNLVRRNSPPRLHVSLVMLYLKTTKNPTAAVPSGASEQS